MNLKKAILSRIIILYGIHALSINASMFKKVCLNHTAMQNYETTSKFISFQVSVTIWIFQNINIEVMHITLLQMLNVYNNMYLNINIF